MSTPENTPTHTPYTPETLQAGEIQKPASTAPTLHAAQVPSNDGAQQTPAGSYNFSGTGAANTMLYTSMPSSKLGFIGFIFSAGGIALYFSIIFGYKAFAVTDAFGRVAPAPAWVGVLALISLVLVPIGTILCAIACFEKDKRKSSAIAGLMLGIIFTTLAILIVTG